MANTIRETILDLMETTLAATSTVGIVVRADDAFAEGHGRWVRQRTPEGLELPGTLLKARENMVVPLDLFIRRTLDMFTPMEELLANVRAAVMADRQWSGNAVDTLILAVQGYALQETKRWGVCTVRVQIAYRTAHDDPTTAA